MPTLQADSLQKLAQELMERMGAEPADARVVAEHLVQANLAGHDSHGILRLPQYYGDVKNGRLAVRQPVEIVTETPATAVLNGNWTWGPVVATRAVELAIAKAKTQALAAVGVRQCHHIGRVGVYPLRAAEQG